MVNRTTIVASLLFLLFALSGPLALAQYPFVASCHSTPKLSASVLEITTAKVERLIQGSSAFPEGMSSGLIIQPIIKLDEKVLPEPSSSGRPLSISGKLLLNILAPGDLVELKSVEVPLYGKGQDAESALRQAILELEATPETIRSAYDAAYAIQEIEWNDCEVFLPSCQALADKGRLSAALVKLGSSPPGTPCSRDANDLWKKLLKTRKKSQCDEMIIAAKAALKEGDDHRALQLAVAADPNCQPEFWQATMTDLNARIPADTRADRRFVDKALDGSLREEDRKNKLYAILFEQVVTEKKSGK